MGRPSKEEIDDIRAEAAKERAYRKALRNTEEAPVEDKYPFNAALLKAIKSQQNTQMPATDQMGNPTGMKKGGMTASKRADGIAQRGKTRGTMVMCGGGMSRK
jgi:hypothetical protein